MAGASLVRGFMTRASSLSALLMLLLTAAVLVLLSGRSLPPVVASHFAVSGEANGFMPRRIYLGLMLALTVGVPLLLVFVFGVVRFINPRFINLPHRAYWLAPERAAATFAYLQSQSIYLAALLTVFLCFVHWLAVRANAVQPPHLSTSLFVAGLVVFLVALVVWMRTFVVHFRRRP
jgi:hypothetical protein